MISIPEEIHDLGGQENPQKILTDVTEKIVDFFLQNKWYRYISVKIVFLLG